MIKYYVAACDRRSADIDALTNLRRGEFLPVHCPQRCTCASGHRRPRFRGLGIPWVSPTVSLGDWPERCARSSPPRALSTYWRKSSIRLKGEAFSVCNFFPHTPVSSALNPAPPEFQGR